VAASGTSPAERILRYLQVRGAARGIFGSSTAWTWIAILAFGARQLRRAMGSEPVVVYRGELRPGDTVQIDHLAETYGGKRVRVRRRRRR
jgi:hypothetical protein